MDVPERGVGRTMGLEPRGREFSASVIGTLAQTGGVLVGAIVDGSVRTWLANDDGQLVLLMWPGNFRARMEPLEVIDHTGHVLARGGDEVIVGGGYLKPGDRRSLGHELAFSAWQVSQR